MKRSHRLIKDADFQNVLSKKISHRSACFTIYGSKQSLGHTRVGLSVSKKIGIAVVRNKIRRQIRMMFATGNSLTESIDYVVIVRSPYLNQTFQQNQHELQQQLVNLRRKIV